METDLMPSPFRRFLFKGFSTFFLFASFALLRIQAAIRLDIPLLDNLQKGLSFGLLYDFLAALLPAIIARALWSVLGFGYTLLWIAAASALWVATLGHRLYQTTFSSDLKIWILTSLYENSAPLRVMSGLLGETWVVFSMLCFCASCFFLFFSPLPRFLRDPYESGIANRAAALGGSFAFAVVFIGLWLAPIFTQALPQTNRSTPLQVLYEHPFTQWTQSYFPWQDTLVRSFSKQPVTAPIPDPPLHTLARFRDWYYFGITDKPLIPPQQASFPLTYPFHTSANQAQILRQQFGLSGTTQPNVLLIILSNVRTFEFQHPDLRTEVFPKLSAWADRGIHYLQAYSPVGASIQNTLQSNFSILCSMFPNIYQPAPQLRTSPLNVQCLGDTLKNKGTQIVHISGGNLKEEGLLGFEASHGFQQFFDLPYFTGTGIPYKTHFKGVDDKSVFEEADKILGRLSTDPRPFFAVISTQSASQPYGVVKEGPLSRTLAKKAQGSSDYLGYLSRLRATDNAVGDFVEKFLQSSLSERTLIVMVGDHGTRIVPPLPLTPSQKIEMEFRVPIFLITKNLKQSMKFQHPVHLMDVVPTLASILGVSESVSWMGRGLIHPPWGTPWIYQNDLALHYRIQNHACYTLPTSAQLECFNLTEDPLFVPPSQKAVEDVKKTVYFEQQLGVARRVLNENKLFSNAPTTPPPTSASAQKN